MMKQKLIKDRGWSFDNDDIDEVGDYDSIYNECCNNPEYTKLGGGAWC